MNAIELSVELVHKTASAVRIYDGSREEWLPMAIIKDEDGERFDFEEVEKGDTVVISIPEHWALEKGLI